MEHKSAVKSVINRNGGKENFNVEKIQKRLTDLANTSFEVDGKIIPAIDTEVVSIPDLTINVLKSCYDGIHTSDLDILAANYCMQLIYKHVDFGRLASRIIISNLQKNILPDIRSMAEVLYRHKDKSGRHFPRINERLYKFYRKYADKLNAILVHERDYLFDTFGAETMIKTYLLKIIDPNSTTKYPTITAERPQHLWLRVAIQPKLTSKDVELTDEMFQSIKLAYDYMSTMVFTHATPTLLNSGLPRNQLVSCNLYSVGDSSEHILDSVKIAGLLSRDGAGLGFAVSDIRSVGSAIRGTGGVSEGITNMAVMFASCMGAFNQGGGKRNGSMALTMEVWHADILIFIDLKKAEGGEHSHRVRSLFYAVFVCDEFMKRVEEDTMWSLMDPDECPNLTVTWGDEFTDLYKKYESEGKARKTIPARYLFKIITERMVETGQPYFQFKDTINRKTNQQGWGTIKCSNLCTEITLPSGVFKVHPHQDLKYVTNPELPVTEYDEVDDLANCNIASISLPAFVRKDNENVWFDFIELSKVAAFVAERLDECIDITKYPMELARETNLRHRPIGIGTQGLANVFYIMGIEWESEEAKKLNLEIFEAIYYGAMSKSTERAKKLGIYPTYQRSPAALGFLQPDLWVIEEEIKKNNLPDEPIRKLIQTYKLPKYDFKDSRFDWETLRAHIAKFGLRNSEVTSPMPTASTSQLFGNYEGNDPAQANLFKRDTNVGSFIVANNYLVKALDELGVWNDDLASYLVRSQGSIQKIQGIPDKIKSIYKTTWEIKQKSVMRLSADRGRFVSQSQSFNIHFADKPASTIGNMLMCCWKFGMKGTYYIRTRAGAEPQSFAITKSDEVRSTKNIESMEKIMATMKSVTWVQPKNEEQVCFLCSS